MNNFQTGFPGKFRRALNGLNKKIDDFAFPILKITFRYRSMAAASQWENVFQ